MFVIIICSGVWPVDVNTGCLVPQKVWTVPFSLIPRIHHILKHVKITNPCVSFSRFAISIYIYTRTHTLLHMKSFCQDLENEESISLELKPKRSITPFSPPRTERWRHWAHEHDFFLLVFFFKEKNDLLEEKEAKWLINYLPEVNYTFYSNFLYI